MQSTSHADCSYPGSITSGINFDFSRSNVKQLMSQDHFYYLDFRDLSEVHNLTPAASEINTHNNRGFQTKRRRCRTDLEKTRMKRPSPRIKT